MDPEGPCTKEGSREGFNTLKQRETKEFYSSHRFAIQMSKLDAVLGSQWGDEGKGKLVDTIGNQ